MFPLYKDRAWCLHGDVCDNSDCYRKLSPKDYEVIKEKELYISYNDLKTSTCGFKPKG